MSAGPFERLPQHWERSRVDRIATVRARIGWKALTATEYVPSGITFLSTPNIKSGEIDFDNVNYIPQWRYDESPELRLQNGDVLLVKDGNTLGITNWVRDLPGPATVNGSIALIRPSRVESRFLRYVLESSPTQGQIATLKAGMGVPHLFQWDINRLPVPVPPFREQHAIADFLDAEATRIDALIAKKDRIMALLEERRWVAFLGRIEAAGGAHVPFRRALKSITDGPFGSAFTSKEYSQEGVSVIRLGNIGFAKFRDADLAYLPSDRFAEFGRFAVREGDVLVAGLGDARNHAGRACVAPDLGDAIVKGKCFCARMDLARADPDYVALWFSSPAGAEAVAVEARGSTRSMINLEVVKSVALPLPSAETQRRIAAETHSDWVALDEVRRSLNAQRLRLMEHRQALITAAVTGELNIPGVAA